MWYVGLLIAAAFLFGLNTCRESNQQRAREICKMDGGTVAEVEYGHGFVCIPEQQEKSKI